MSRRRKPRAHLAARHDAARAAFDAARREVPAVAIRTDGRFVDYDHDAHVRDAEPRRAVYDHTRPNARPTFDPHAGRKRTNPAILPSWDTTTVTRRYDGTEADRYRHIPSTRRGDVHQDGWADRTAERRSGHLD